MRRRRRTRNRHARDRRRSRQATGAGDMRKRNKSLRSLHNVCGHSSRGRTRRARARRGVLVGLLHRRAQAEQRAQTGQEPDPQQAHNQLPAVQWRPKGKALQQPTKKEQVRQNYAPTAHRDETGGTREETDRRQQPQAQQQRQRRAGEQERRQHQEQERRAGRRHQHERGTMPSLHVAAAALGQR